MSPDVSIAVAALSLIAGVEYALLERGSSRNVLRRAWEAIHRGEIARGELLLQPFLCSALPRRREPARIALLAAARIRGDREGMRRLLESIDRRALSERNQGVLLEEQVRVLVALGEAEQAVEAARALLRLPAADAQEDLRRRSLLAYALMADGRTVAAETELLALCGRYRAVQGGTQGGTQEEALTWLHYQLGRLYQKERREGEAALHLSQAVAAAPGSALAALAQEALRAAPERL